MTGKSLSSDSGEKASSRDCPVKMLYGACSRPIYSDTSSVDPIPLCIMHSADPAKDQNAFMQEFDRTLRETSKDCVADFFGFVFPSSHYEKLYCESRCRFFWATFTKEVTFSGAKFLQGADFSTATFKDTANFQGATFRGTYRLQLGKVSKGRQLYWRYVWKGSDVLVVRIPSRCAI